MGDSNKLHTMGNHISYVIDGAQTEEDLVSLIEKLSAEREIKYQERLPLDIDDTCISDINKQDIELLTKQLTKAEITLRRLREVRRKQVDTTCKSVTFTAYAG